MEKRIVTRGKRGDVIRIVEYYEPQRAKDRMLKVLVGLIGLGVAVGVVLGIVMNSLYSDVKRDFCRSTQTRF